MKKLLISLALLALPVVASAQPGTGNGVDIAWQDCVGGPGSVSFNRNLNCVGNSTHNMMLTFKVGVDLPNFQAFTAYLKLKNETNPVLLTPFWHYEQGGCNRNTPTFPTGLAMTLALPGAAGCAIFTDIDQALNPVFNYAYGPDVPGGGGILLAALAHSGPLALSAGSTPDISDPNTWVNNYFAMQLQFNTRNRTGASANCAGCTDKVAIVFNTAVLESQGEPDYIISSRDKAEYCGPASRRALTLNGPLASADICDATPVRTKTWGAVKALYR